MSCPSGNGTTYRDYKHDLHRCIAISLPSIKEVCFSIVTSTKEILSISICSQLRIYINKYEKLGIIHYSTLSLKMEQMGNHNSLPPENTECQHDIQQFLATNSVCDKAMKEPKMGNSCMIHL